MNILRVAVTDEQGNVLQEEHIADPQELPWPLVAAVLDDRFVRCKYAYKLDGQTVVVQVQRMVLVESRFFQALYNSAVQDALAEGLRVRFTLSCGHTSQAYYRDTQQAAAVASQAKEKEQPCHCELCTG
jgi:hypothetical protein